MLTINVQFHMLFDELVAFVAGVSAEFPLSLELERWTPRALREVPTGVTLASAIEDFGEVHRIWLVYKPLGAKRAERSVINVGAVRGDRLQQSQLGGATNSQNAFTVFKGVVAELKRRTPFEMWTISATGHVGRSRSFRASAGAASASRAGQIVLTDMAFGLPMYVDPPE